MGFMMVQNRIEQNKFINQIRAPGGHIQITIMIDTQQQYINLNIRGEISIIVVYVLPGHSRQTPLSTYVLSYFPFSTRWTKPAFVYYFQQKLMEILLYQSSSQMKLELQFLQLMLTVHSSMDIFVLVCLKNTDLLPSVSVSVLL